MLDCVSVVHPITPMDGQVGREISFRDLVTAILLYAYVTIIAPLHPTAVDKVAVPDLIGFC